MQGGDVATDPERDGQTLRSGEHERLAVLVGTWRTTGRTYPLPSAPAAEIDAIDTYEWLPGGYFLIHRVDALVGTDEVKGIEIIGYDPTAGTYRAHWFDNRGSTDTFQAELDGDVWRMWSARERFTGRFSPDRNSISGTWECSSDGSTWDRWMEVTLTKMSPTVVR
jgi:hypothetical protein